MKPPVITLLDYSVTQEHTSKPDREDEREEEGESFGARKQRFKEWQEGKVKERLVFLFLFFLSKGKQIPLNKSWCTAAFVIFVLLPDLQLCRNISSLQLLKFVSNIGSWIQMSAMEETGFWKRIFREYSAPINYEQIREWIDGSMGL